MTNRIDEIFNQVMDEDCADPLRRFADLVRQDERQALAQPEQEPVAWMNKDGWIGLYKQGDATIPLYTAPPKREWVGLTDEEIGDVYVAWDNTDGASFADFARLIETKSRSKNNG